MIHLRDGLIWSALFSVSLLAKPTSGAEEFYCYRPVRELKTFEEKLPDGVRPLAANEVANGPKLPSSRALRAYGTVIGGGELYILDEEVRQGGENQPEASPLETLQGTAIVAVRLPELPKGDVLSGWLYVPRNNGMWMKPVKFFFQLKPVPADAKAVFAKAKQRHYEQLVFSGIPGSAWFQHQVRSAQALVADPNGGGGRASSLLPRGDLVSATESERLFALFSGSRAINENLQLDRPITDVPADRSSKPNEAPPVALGNLLGITTAEIDWKPLIAGKTPSLDPLAPLIPHDQHALFLPDLKGVETLVAEASSRSAPIWRSLGIDDQFKSVFGRYERQLGIGLAELVKDPASRAIKSIVLTGSDTYFISGTDIALIFQTETPKELVEFLKRRLHTARLSSEIDVLAPKVEKEGIVTTSARSVDRRLSSYVAETADAVILSNSALQLETILATSRGEKPSLTTSPDYQYFRLKYPRAEGGETAFLVLSDATIRRWCGPRWRIGSSRRSRAVAGLAALQSDYLAEIVAGKDSSDLRAPSSTTILGVDLGEVRLTKQGIRSRTFGNFEFQTPISELPLETVTKIEADSYERWRDGYQSNWRGTFDPIAVRIKIDPGKHRRIGLDLTVTPLIANTNYRDIIKLVGGASFVATDGDPHPEALIQAITAIDVKSSLLQSGADMLRGTTNLPKESLLGWVGKSVSVYADQGPVWTELLKAGNTFRFAEDNLSRLPIGAHVEVNDGLKLALFLGGVRAFAEQTTPGLVAWESREYKGRKYVRIAEQPGARPDPGPGKERFALYYVTSPRALVISPNEAVITRFLDRAAAKPAAFSGWLGRNVGLRLTSEGMELLKGPPSAGYRDLMRMQSWNNLPILNEWHRLAPDRDPVQLHEEFWGERLICPGGGTYVWDEQWQTMKSTAFDHPGEPKPGPNLIAPLPDIEKADFGINFEDGGLRGRAEIEFREKY